MSEDEEYDIKFVKIQGQRVPISDVPESLRKQLGIKIKRKGEKGETKSVDKEEIKPVVTDLSKEVCPFVDINMPPTYKQDIQERKQKLMKWLIVASIIELGLLGVSSIVFFALIITVVLMVIMLMMFI